MSQYLSQEWLDAYKKLAASQPERPGTDLKVQYQIMDGPQGDVQYHWVIEGGRIVEAKLGTVEDADFTVVMQYEDAVKLVRGQLNPMTAFMQRKMKVSGNAGRMMALMPMTNSAEWKQLENDVREMTEF